MHCVIFGILLWVVMIVLCPMAAATEPGSCTALLRPTVCYDRYLETIRRAAQLRELHVFLTAERVQLLERGLANAKAAGADTLRIEQATLQHLQRGAGPPDRVREQRFEHDASLLVDRPGVTIEVRLVIEGGSWRIADEHFRATPRF